MTTQPLVSVITIFLNAEQFIQAAIESVLSQTYQNFELLLVDDGSTDKSTNIAQDAAEKWPQKIRYLDHADHQNLGMSAARNWGIAHAKGQYIAFLDADDIWLPLKLEKQVNVLDQQLEASMVFSPSKLWYSWTGKPEDVERDWIETVAPQMDRLIEPPTLFLQSMLAQKMHSASTCSLLVRRSALEKWGGFESEFRGLYEDQVFLTKLYLQERIYVMSDCLDLYRQHPNSCVYMQAGDRVRQTARSGFLTWIEAYLHQQNITNPEIWTAFNEATWPYRHPWLHRFQEMIVPVGRLLLPMALREWLWQRWSHRKQPALKEQI